MASRSGLGRGLSALIPQHEPEETVGAPTGLLEVAVASVRPNRHQPRRNFDEDGLDELTASVRELGVLQPLLVRQVEDGEFELIAGERRLRAARRAGLSTVPVVVRTADEAASLEQALVENLHRQDLNPLEEAAAYQRLIEEFDHTQEEVAQRVGRSRSAVANLLRLFQLTPSVQKMVGDGQLSAGHAKALLGHPDRSYQEAMARKAIQENLSVRQLEDLIRQRLELESGRSETADDADQQSGGAEPRGDGGRSKLRQPGLLELEELLATHLDTRVGIAMTARHGRVTIEFADLEDLERIYRRIIGA